jgi:hypothetical protein
LIQGRKLSIFKKLVKITFLAYIMSLQSVPKSLHTSNFQLDSH